MKVFRKPNPWFTIYMIGAMLFGPLLLVLHIISIGAFNGWGLGEKWADYCLDKDIKCAKGH